VRVVPSRATWGGGDGAILHKSGTFVGVLCGDVEQGARVCEDSVKHFFVMHKGASMSFKFETEGIGKVQQNKSGKLVFADDHGNPLFVYSKPALKVNGAKKKISPTTAWNDKTKELHIEIGVKCPVGIVCAVCTCTLPPANIMYTADDALHVLHPRVNFIGQASGKGVSFRPLKTNDEDGNWSIGLSLENSKVIDVYAKSKCTAVLVRDNDITEYLSYVDRGDYLGLHHSFHIHKPPANAGPDEPLRIPLALTLTGIARVAHDAGGGGALTFHATARDGSGGGGGGGAVFTYAKLAVVDAHGMVLHSQMRREGDDRLVLEVLESGEYPLIIG